MNEFSKFTTLSLITALSTGCVITYMDKPWPKNSQLFTNEGEDINATKQKLSDCSLEVDKNYPNNNINQGINYVHYCMLKAGYKFNNAPGGSPYCVRGSFTWDQVACLFHRGKITRYHDGTLEWPDGTTVRPENFMTNQKMKNSFGLK